MMDSKDHTMKGIKISIKKQKSFFTTYVEKGKRMIEPQK